MIYENIESILKKNESLSNYSTYNTGGNASFLAFPTSAQELINILKYSKEKNLDFFIFGHGSNLIFPEKPKEDKVFISLKIFLDYELKNKKLYLSAGIPSSLLAMIGALTKEEKLYFTYLLPGTLGAAIYINARCYDAEISEIIERVYYIDLSKNDFKIKSILAKDCKFGYKSSIFQYKPWIIIGCDIKISSITNDVITYLENTINILKEGDINLSSLPVFYKFFSEEAKKLKAVPNKLKEIEESRNSKYHFDYPSCGSVFKNDYLIGAPMGKIIEKLNLKGTEFGGAKVSPFHGNIIINFNNAKSYEIIILIEYIKNLVLKNHGFLPEPEITIIQE